MQFGAHVLDDYLAPRLSELRNCQVPDVPELPHYRGSLILNHVFCGLMYPDELRVPISLFITRLREATAEYRSAVENLRKYVSALPDHGQLGAHTCSVAHFETCILKADLAATVLTKAIAAVLEAPPIWSKDDGSIFERIHLIANRIKHFDEDIAKATRRKEPLPLAPMWLINDGLECSGCIVTFEEFAFILKDMAEDAENLSEKWPALAAERRRQKLGGESQPGDASADTPPPQPSQPKNVVMGHLRIGIPAP